MVKTFTPLPAFVSKAIRVPSGDQTGFSAPSCPTRVICLRPVPSGLIVKSWARLPAAAWKTIGPFVAAAAEAGATSPRQRSAANIRMCVADLVPIAVPPRRRVGRMLQRGATDPLPTGYRRAVIEFGILGPLEARRDGAPLALGGRNQRAVL